MRYGFKAPLEILLNKYYGAPAIKWMYDIGARELTEGLTGSQGHSASPPQHDPKTSASVRPRPSKQVKPPTKAEHVEVLLRIFRDPELCSRFLEALPSATQECIRALAWKREVNLVALEQELGITIADVNPDLRLVYRDPLHFLPEHTFLVIANQLDYGWAYLHSSSTIQKERFNVALPSAIRAVFRAVLTPPPDYELLPVEHPPADAIRYSGSAQLLDNLGTVAKYVSQGHLRYTKSEAIAIGSLRTLANLIGGTEFFVGDAVASDLAMLRGRLLVGGIASIGAKFREEFLANPESADPVRRLLEAIMVNARFLHEELLAHFSAARNRHCGYDAKVAVQLTAFYGQLPSGKWVSWENIRQYHFLRELEPCLFDRTSSSFQANIQRADDSWSRTVTLADNNMFEIVSVPLLKGYAFMLAALGLAEIAYALPTHPLYHRTGTGYLSPFDGLQAVRLTQLGEYVVGKRGTFEITRTSSNQSRILLDESRLVATCWNTDRITDLTLRQFMDPLAPGRYRMTHKTLLGGCSRRKDVEERLRLFRRVVSAKPPAIWERFFEETLARIAPFRRQHDYLVLKINNDEELRRLLSTDPILRDAVLKVEGLRIALHLDNIRAFTKRLEHFGYLIPNDSLT